MRMRAVLFALLVSGCSSSGDPETANGAVDASAEDTSTSFVDSGVVPEVSSDAGSDSGASSDAAADALMDASKFDILGTLAGECGGLVAELTKTTPSLQANALTFVAGEKYVKESMSIPGGVKMFETANAGGSSGESEVMAFEILHYCEDAKLLKTETEIAYAPPDDSGANTITDLEVEIAGKKVGVSVTRAYKPAPLTMTDAELKTLLEKKLEGINRSSVRVLAVDKWVKQILSVFVANADVEAAVKRVLPTISATIRADTIVLLTRTAGGGFIYCNPDPALGAECPAL